MGLLALGIAGFPQAQADTALATRGAVDTLCTVSINGKNWRSEYVDTPEERQRGLMFRRAMPSAHGMLFRFDEERQVSMWMKNTFIPLDMIFIGEDQRVARVHKGAVPESLATISSGGPVRYVLEINAGEALLAGIEIGQRVSETCSDR